MWAEATASAQGPTPTPIVLVGPRTLVDGTRQYSLELPEGWWAVAVAGTTLTNYDSDKLTDVHQLPPGGIKVYLGIGSLDGLSVNELIENKKAREVAAYNEDAPGSADNLKFTDVQPLQLGPHPAFEYYMTTPEQFVIRYIVLSQDDRIITIAISPADSRAMDEALMILSTLTFLPR